MNTSTGNPCGHQEQQNDLSVDEEPLLQKGCFGSHRGDSDEPQARRRGQGSTSQETVHHAEMGRRARCHSWLSSL